MRIALDTSPTRSGHGLRGVGSYTKLLVEALKASQGDHTIIEWDPQKTSIPDADILHFPYFDPFFITLPIYTAKPTVVTVHDLIPILFPEHFPKGLRGMVKWEIQRLSLKRKQHIITDSQSSKKDIHSLTGMSENKIDVIYLAPSIKSHEGENSIIRFSIKNDYFLAVGDVNWNKNIPGLLRAFSKLKESQTKIVKLVLVGKAYENESLPEVKEIQKLIEELKIREDVITTGYVTESELIGLYKNALALVQPSFYEGFGFPVLDAFFSGCPVVCADASSLREIAGPSLLIDPFDIQSIADGMKLMITMDNKKRLELVANGHAWEKQFTWQKVAKHTIDVYEKVLGKK